MIAEGWALSVLPMNEKRLRRTFFCAIVGNNMEHCSSQRNTVSLLNPQSWSFNWISTVRYEKKKQFQFNEFKTLKFILVYKVMIHKPRTTTK